MNKLVASFVLGIVGFLFSIVGIFSLVFSIPGLFLAIASIKTKGKKVTLPFGYVGSYGKKRISAQPYFSTRYIAFIALGLNAFSIAVSLFTTFVIAALFTAATATQ